MRISNTEIVKGLSVERSIQLAITKMFNEKAAALYLTSIEFKDGYAVHTGTHGDENYNWVQTTYFIATKMGGDFIRVDCCYEQGE